MGMIQIWLDLEGLGSREPNEDGRHVVTSDSFLGILGEQKVKHVFHESLLIFLVPKVGPYRIYESLAVIYVALPDSITSHQDELISSLPIKLPNVRLTCYHLFVVCQIGFAFVVEVSQWSGEVETSIYSSHANLSTCLDNSFLLFRRFRLMVLAQSNRISGSAEHTSRVACVGYVDLFVCD